MQKETAKTKPNILRIDFSKYFLPFMEWGSAPNPAKGLSDCPLETFGHKILGDS